MSHLAGTLELINQTNGSQYCLHCHPWTLWSTHSNCVTLVPKQWEKAGRFREHLSAIQFFSSIPLLSSIYMINKRSMGQKGSIKAFTISVVLLYHIQKQNALQRCVPWNTTNISIVKLALFVGTKLVKLPSLFYYVPLQVGRMNSIGMRSRQVYSSVITFLTMQIGYTVTARHK